MPRNLIPPRRASPKVVLRGPTESVATVTPELLGLPLYQARWFAGLAELAVVVTRATAAGPAGHVLSQYPTAGESSTRGGPIHIVVSSVEQVLKDGRER